MPVNVKCPTCGHVCRLADDSQEQEILCPSCRSYFPRTSQSASSLLGRTPHAESAPPPATTPQNRTLLAQPEAMIRYTCPRCKKSLESPVSFAGQKLNCPGCNQRLQIPQPSTPAPPPVNKTILATEESAVTAPLPVPTPPPQPTSPPAVRPLDTLAVVDESPSKREPERPSRRESCLECGANITGRSRVQTCSDCGSSFCSAACYREHRYYSHSRRRKKKRRPEKAECPYCDSTARPYSTWVISQNGWIVFIILLIFFFPLCWIGLLMTDPVYRCSDCGRQLY
jgi:DNA-directed RNA polymerase subunit RPC12/RpoP